MAPVQGLPSLVRDVDGNEQDRRGTVSVFNGPDPVVRVFDVQGRFVTSLRSSRVSRAQARATWSGDDEHGSRVGAGTYFLEASTPTGSLVTRVTLTR